MTRKILKLSAICISYLALNSLVLAAEYPIGEPKIQDGIEIAAVYLQPIKMDPEGIMRKAEDSDIHLEADISAVQDNPNGFAEGSWMPYLVVHYELIKEGEKETIKGHMMPMVASDGPHYGDNVKLKGNGRYKLKLNVEAPNAHEKHKSEKSNDPKHDDHTMMHSHGEFGRHVDKETGVGAWFKPINVEYDFVFAGIGKKGSY
ncbi:MAG: iron transporter [Alphaproteobacteria bacterium]|nr:iron transporter [Alphaproteobacteria bacterium]